MQTRHFRERSKTGKILIPVTPELFELIPGFVSRRLEDVERARAGLERGRLEPAVKLSHDWQECAPPYGFEELALLGAQIGAAAEDDERDRCGTLLDRAEAFLTTAKAVTRQAG